MKKSTNTSSAIQAAFADAGKKAELAGATIGTRKLEIEIERGFYHASSREYSTRVLISLSSRTVVHACGHWWMEGVASEAEIVVGIGEALEDALREYREREQIERVREAIRAENKITDAVKTEGGVA